MVIIKAKTVKALIKESGKQINKGALEILNKAVVDYVTQFITKQSNVRITEKNVTL